MPLRPRGVPEPGGGASAQSSLYLVAVVGSLVVLVATGLRPLSTVDGDVRALLGFLDASSENNVASWWGGMLFLLASLYARDCSLRIRDQASGVRTAWLAISGILLFFSADEVSSFHERMGAPGVALGPAVWLSARDIMALCFAGAAFVSLLRLWLAPAQRRAAVGLFLGFLILATIYPQETLEHRIEWAGEGVRTLRLLVEEGTELLGSLVLLRVSMKHASRESVDHSTGRTPATFGVLGPLTSADLCVYPAHRARRISNGGDHGAAVGRQSFFVVGITRYACRPTVDRRGTTTLVPVGLKWWPR